MSTVYSVCVLLFIGLLYERSGGVLSPDNTFRFYSMCWFIWLLVGIVAIALSVLVERVKSCYRVVTLLIITGKEYSGVVDYVYAITRHLYWDTTIFDLVIQIFAFPVEISICTYCLLMKKVDAYCMLFPEVRGSYIGEVELLNNLLTDKYAGRLHSMWYLLVKHASYDVRHDKRKFAEFVFTKSILRREEIEDESCS